MSEPAKQERKNLFQRRRRGSETAKKKSEKKASSKIAFRRPYQSTQFVLPIKDFYKGIIITKDGHYVKIIEVKPIAFLMMTPAQQSRIAESFGNVIRVGPTNLQITEMTLPANLSVQLDNLHEAMEKETSEQCLVVDAEYEKRLLQSQGNGISRRFFISFEYEKRVKAGQRRNSMDQIVYEMNTIASSIIRQLQGCGNDVVVNDPDRFNYYPAEILYSILNRRMAVEESYEDHLSDVYRSYIAHYRKMDVYIPPTEYIAPDTISFRDKKYVVVDGLYYSFYYVPSEGYNPRVLAGWLTPFINSLPGVDINIYFHKVPNADVMTSLRKNQVYSQVDMNSVSFASEAMDNAESTFGASKYLKDGLNNGDTYVEMALMITITGKDPEAIDTKMDYLNDKAVQSGIRIRPCTYDEERAFFCSLPLGKCDELLFKKAKRNCLATDAGSTYPFTTLEINDDNGVLVGDDTKTGSLVILDLFNEERFINYNVFIQGASGAGKTYAELLLALRMRIMHIPVFVLLPEKEDEGRRLSSAIDGQFIQLAPGSPNRINIMEIFPMDFEARRRAALINGEHEDSSFLSEKITALKDWFSLLITDMSIEEKQLLDKALVLTYAKFGITENNNSLFDPDDPEHVRYRKMPIISDLQEELFRNPDTHRMANIMEFFTTGSGKSFNGQTNVNLNNEFICFGLEKMKNELRPLGLYMAMDFVWSKIRQDPLKNKALFIDEWWALGKDPVCAEYSMQISKLIRAYHGAFIPCTQQLKDIMAVNNGQYGEALLGNCATRILMRTEENDSINVQRLLNLTETEREQIVNFKGKGNALFMTGNTKVTIRFVASPMEHALITTSQEDQKRILASKLKADNPDAESDVDDLVILEDESEYIYLVDDEEYYSRAS